MSNLIMIAGFLPAERANPRRYCRALAVSWGLVLRANGPAERLMAVPKISYGLQSRPGGDAP